MLKLNQPGWKWCTELLLSWLIKVGKQLLLRYFSLSVLSTNISIPGVSQLLFISQKRKFAWLTFLFFFSIWSLPLCVLLCVEQTTCSVVRWQRVLALAKEWASSCHVSAGLLQQSWCFCCIKDHILAVCSVSRSVPLLSGSFRSNGVQPAGAGTCVQSNLWRRHRCGLHRAFTVPLVKL